jgi:hypothetical protein
MLQNVLLEAASRRATGEFRACRRALRDEYTAVEQRAWRTL